MGKSELKKIIFRRMNNVCAIVTHPRVGYKYGSRDDARTIFVDALVTWAAGPFVRDGPVDGQTFVDQTFVRMIEAAFADHAHLHTFVLSFDKAKFVPPEKAITQQRRQQQLANQVTEAVTFDDVNVPIVSPLHTLPSWAALRSNRAANARAQREAIALIGSRVRVPAGRRLIVDYDSTCLVVECEDAETSPKQRSYTCEALVNDVGEADLLAMHYARMATGLGRRAAVFANPPPPPLDSSLANYCRRREYEFGPVVLCSSDTDWLSLVTLHANPQFCVYVSVGAAPNDQGYEVYDARRLALAVPRRDAISFNVLTAMAGNDYVDKIPSISQRLMYDAYCRLDRPLVAVVDNRLRVDSTNLMLLIMYAYAIRLGQVMPEVGDYPRLVADLTARLTNFRALSAAEIVDLQRSLTWSINYSVRGHQGDAQFRRRSAGGKRSSNDV